MTKEISITKKELKSCKEKIGKLESEVADEGDKVKEEYELKLQKLQEELECTKQERDSALKAR